MANVVLILGNGFDIDIGLKSKYSDFIQGKEWIEICNGLIPKITDKFQHVSLLKHMYEASNTPDLWFDVENEIHKFILDYPIYKVSLSDESIRELAQKEYNILKERLYQYLLRISDGFVVDESKWSYRLLKALTESNDNISALSFNYTDSCALCKLPPIDFTYIHGNLKDKDIVLGCEVIGREYIPKPLRFLVKSNMINRPNNIIEKLMFANEVVFYGHSVNAFDFPYFREFFINICAPIEHDLHLTFITRDHNSELDIRDNLSQQGIPVQNLFKSNITTTFIHTEPNKSNVLKDQDSFNLLLDRIKGE